MIGKGDHFRCLVQALLILLSVALVGCAVAPGPSGTPGGVIHFPEVESADWVTSLSSVCIQVEQSYPGVTGHSEPIAETLQGVLSRIGVEATVGQGAECEATLSVAVEVRPVAKDYAGSIEDCYTSAEAAGEATLSASGRGKLTLPLSYTVQGSQIISECPTQPNEAPLAAAWAQAVVPLLGQWWGSPALVSALEADTYQVRWAATNQLALIGPEASEAMPVLVEMLGDDDPGTREAAANTLGRFGEAAAEAIPALVEAIDDTEVGVRYAAITALGDIGDAQVVPALVKTLHHSDSYARYLAAQALGKLGPEAAPAIPDLLETIDDEFTQSGWAAVDALGAIGPQAEEAIPVLIELLEAEDWTFHSNAANALAKITGQDFGEDGAAWRRWWESQQ
jgi:hypothetical protein